MAESKSVIKGIEQGRAKFAYEKVKAVEKNENYKSCVKKIPMMIKTNGLGATLAFMNAKGNEYTTILNHIREQLTRINLSKASDNKGFIDEVISCDSSKYRQRTIEVLAFLNWLRRFAEGLIEGEAGND